MTLLDIIRVIVCITSSTELTVKTIINATGYANEAAPYIALCFIGNRYCRAFLGISDNPTVIQELLSKSPSDIMLESNNSGLVDRIIYNAKRERERLTICH